MPTYAAQIGSTLTGLRRSHAADLGNVGLNEEPELAVGRALVLNPGQGHLALSLWKLSRPDHVVLMDRDLLALRYSRRNLVLNGCPDEHVTPVHRPGIVPDDWGEIDVVVGGLREDLAAEHVALALGHLAGRMSSGGRMLVAARSTTMTRVVEGLRSEKRLRVEMERRRRGNVVVVLRAAKKVKRNA